MSLQAKRRRYMKKNATGLCPYSSCLKKRMDSLNYCKKHQELYRQNTAERAKYLKGVKVKDEYKLWEIEINTLTREIKDLEYITYLKKKYLWYATVTLKSLARVGKVPIKGKV